MAGPVRERADAARNRAAILRATERLLAERGAEHVSLDAVAAAAGVGKGTVFRRFGSRTGLLRALVENRMTELYEAVETGPPPLGPGAPAAERLAAFLAAMVDAAARNIALVCAYEYSVASPQPAAAKTARPANEVYDRWHAHVAGLVRGARPNLDADLIGHLLLGALHTEPIRRLLADGQRDRVTAALRVLIDPLLGGPAR